jgi:hypothetical protein
MSNETHKPSHRLVRYYGSGRNAARAEIGAVWTKPDGSLAIRLDSPTEQVWFQAFPIPNDH